jgi:hypothetical protein
MNDRMNLLLPHSAVQLRWRQGASGMLEVRPAFLLLVLWLWGQAGSRCGAAETSPDLSARLAQLDATVMLPEERKMAARKLAEDVDQRLRQANAQSSAEWRSVTNRAAWEQFRAAKLEALRHSLGQPAAPAALRPQVTGSISGQGYAIQNLVFQSRPGLWVTANLYRPDKPRASMPGLLICHAHHAPKEHGELQDMGVTWAKAGCVVLVMDQLGHGERRQHPFNTAADHPRPYQVSRQDYYFRYDLGIQLHLAGESLIGWMAWDLRRGVDLLLATEGVDAKRIILLGAVAGGGDPAAVAVALDDRIAAAVPFNFGGPQPETRYPLPDDAETSFDYAGSGGWESTRNLRRSAVDGFLPWVIVGGIAPRRLVYGHEFSWDQERDPVWKRLQKIFGLYQAPDLLAFAHGRGELRGQPPEASHCTHIGPVHRQLIHAAFKAWFGIDVTNETSDRHVAAALRAMTPEVERELQPPKLADLLSELAAERVAQARQRLADLPGDQRRRRLQTAWAGLLGNVEPALPSKLPANPGGPLIEEEAATGLRVSVKTSETLGGASVERIVLATGAGTIPVLLLKSRGADAASAGKPPVVVAVAQAGKQRLLRSRAKDVAALLDRGLAVCLPDVRGTGETGIGSGRGRRSAATAWSSSELMLGQTTLGAQLRELRTVLAWLRTREDLDARQLSLWGDSLVQPNPPETNFQVPRDDDDALPRSPEPLGGLLALLAALYEDDVQAVYVHGGLASYGSVLTSHLALLPHDVVVPGVLTAGDLCDLAGSLAPRPLRLEGVVDGWNRLVPAPTLARAYAPAATSYREAGAAARFSASPTRTGPGQWLPVQGVAP